MKIISRLITLKRLLAAFGFALPLALGLVQGASAAGQGSLSLSSSSTTYGQGSSFAVTVNEDSGSVGVNAIEADLTFDSTKLQYVGVDSSTSAFPIPGPVAANASGVNISRGIADTAVTGKHIVAVVNFKVSVNSGTTDIGFANSSAIVEKDNASNVWDGNTTGLTITLNSQTPSSGATSTTSSSANLVAVKVINRAGAPLQGVPVTLSDGQTISTDSSGVASFTGVPAGSEKITAVYQGKTLSLVATVKPLDSKQVQQATFRFGQAKTSTAKTAVLVILLVIMVVAAGLWLGKMLHHMMNHTPGNNQPSQGNNV